MELRQLAYIIAAIDHGGFTRAAGVLHVTQPSLLQGIRTLEDDSGWTCSSVWAEACGCPPPARHSRRGPAGPR